MLNRRNVLLLLLAALVMSLLVASSAMAQEARRYKNTLQTLNQKLVSLEKQDPDGLVKNDILEIQKKVQEASFQLGQEEYNRADRILRLVEAKLALAEATLGFQKAKTDADKKMSELEELRARHNDLKAKLEGTNGKIKMLQGAPPAP